MEVRRLAETDSIAELTSLLHAAYAELLVAGFRYYATHQDDKATRDRVNKGECWVAVIDGELVATVTVVPPWSTKGTPWYDRPVVASVGQLGVHPAFRGRGIGMGLLEMCEQRARQMGAVEIALDTAEGATRLIETYARRGYRFVEYADWRPTTNYRSVVLSKALDPFGREL